MATEYFPKTQIDMMCSISPDALYNALYKSTADAKNAACDLNKSTMSNKAYTKKDSLVYLGFVIDSCKMIQKNNYKWNARYNFSKNCPTFGRKYVERFGIQKLERNIRGFLTQELYVDVDKKNAHPCILKHLIKTHCPLILTPILDSYCTDRENFLKTTSLTKVDFLKHLNMVKCNTKTTPDILIKFVAELLPVKNYFWENYPSLQTNSGWNAKSSLLNKLMCKEESILLERAISHLDIKNPVRMFDGFMILKSELPEDTIDKLNLLTKPECIVWDVKEPVSFSFPEIKILPKPKPVCLLDAAAIRADDPSSYENVKKRFEKNRFVVTDPLCYVTEKIENGEIVLYRSGKTEFNNKTENWYFTLFDEDGMQSKLFMNKWFLDPHRRTYDRIDFLPPPMTCPSNIYNLYTGMAYQNISVEPDNNIDVFLNHLRVLSGDDQQEEVYNYQLNYHAHMLQFPGVMPGTALLWNSQQGAGKNIWTNGWRESVIGKKSTISTEDAEEFVGKWRNISNKFFGVYNEASSRDTYGLDNKIKALITEPFLSWEAKGKDTITVNNFIRMFFLTNKDNGVKIEPGDRRFQVVQISTVIKEKSYFDAIGAAWNNPAKVLGLANYLLQLDISNWDPQRDRVVTDFYKAMMSKYIPSRELWLATFLREIDEIDDPFYRWKPIELYNSYCKFMENKNKSSKAEWTPDTRAMFGRQLKNPQWEGAIKGTYSNKSCRYYTINRENLVKNLIEKNIITEEELYLSDDEVEIE